MSVSAEPTAMACLALSAHGVESPHVAAGLDWLTKTQRPDGGVPISASLPSPCWPTALSVLAWLRGGKTSPDAAKGSIDRAVKWIIGSEGRALPHDPDLFGHDTTLVGWSWVDGTHSWAEPTAYAVLALRAAGLAGHARVRQGVRLLTDRLLPDGGWNYGNTRVLRNTLRPFPATTGVVLSALAGETSDSRIGKSVDYLTRELETIRTPLSLGWGLIGLAAWDATPPESGDWLAESAQRSIEGSSSALDDALLLLADAQWCLPATPKVDRAAMGSN